MSYVIFSRNLTSVKIGIKQFDHQKYWKIWNFPSVCHIHVHQNTTGKIRAIMEWCPFYIRLKSSMLTSVTLAKIYANARQKEVSSHEYGVGLGRISLPLDPVTSSWAGFSVLSAIKSALTFRVLLNVSSCVSVALQFFPISLWVPQESTFCGFDPLKSG